jgi:hypothetical protein
MFGQCKRRDSVPAGYRSLRDALTVLIEAETSGQTTAIDQLSEQQIEEGREKVNSLIQEMIFAVQNESLDPWAWNRKTNQLLRLSTEVFSRQFSDLHFSGAQLFFLGLPDRERFLEDWLGLFEEKQFQRWSVERQRSASNEKEAEPKSHKLKEVGRPPVIHILIEVIGELYISGEYPSVKTIRNELRSATPPVRVSETTIKRALKALKTL